MAEVNLQPELAPNPADFGSNPIAPSKGKGRFVFLVLLLISIIVGGLLLFGGTKQADAPAIEQAKVTAHITINDVGFVPGELHVKAGSTVTWTNQGTKPHQVAADPHPKNDSIPGFDSDQLLQPKDTYSFIFEKPGTYHYHDQLDPMKMLGKVVVE